MIHVCICTCLCIYLFHETSVFPNMMIMLIDLALFHPSFFIPYPSCHILPSPLPPNPHLFHLIFPYLLHSIFFIPPPILPSSPFPSFIYIHLSYPLPFVFSPMLVRFVSPSFHLFPIFPILFSFPHSHPSLSSFHLFLSSFSPHFIMSHPPPFPRAPS